MNASQSLLNNVLWHGMHIPLTWHSSFQVMSQSNAFLDTVQPESKHSQPRENYGGVFTNHTGPSIWSRYLKHSHPKSIPCCYIDRSTAHSSDSRQGTLSKAPRAEVWSVEEHGDVLIHCLGGPHISMNYLSIIGRHMSDSGLSDLWVGCDILGANSAQNVMGGKEYARSIRIH